MDREDLLLKHLERMSLSLARIAEALSPDSQPQRPLTRIANAIEAIEESTSQVTTTIEKEIRL